MRFKRALAILLTALLLLPLGVAMRGTAETTEDVWALIAAIEDDALSGKKSSKTTAEDYAKLSESVAETVLAWDGYAEDSLVKNGSVLFWDGTDGAAYGYLPELRAKLHNARMAKGRDVPGTETYAFGSRGGQPDGVDVTVFQPYYGIDLDFTTQYPDEGVSIARTAGGTCTVRRGDDATIDAIADALETSAVVIFDSHGITDEDALSPANTSYLCIGTDAGLTAEDTRTVQGPHSAYKHAFDGGLGYADGHYMRLILIDGTAIANHMDNPAPNNFLWMAICLGMATDGLCAPLREKGVEVVYGYSQSVTFDGDYEWEECFWEKMKRGSTVAEAAAHMKQEIGVCDPYVDLDDDPAYPIFVSGEDAYPGQGGVDAEQTVYSTWILTDLLRGDANDDGRITAADTAAVLRYVVGLASLDELGMRNADVDGDGELTAEDAVMILRYVVNQVDAFS